MKKLWDMVSKRRRTRGLTKRAQAAERLFMEAMAEAGFKVTEDGKIIGVNDEEEKEDKRDESTATEKTDSETEQTTDEARKMLQEADTGIQFKSVEAYSKEQLKTIREYLNSTNQTVLQKAEEQRKGAHHIFWC